MVRLKQLAQEGAATGDLAVWSGTSWVPATPRDEAVTTEAISSGDVVMADTLNATPRANAWVQLYFNGQRLRQGAGNDYTVSGTAITWLRGTGTAPKMKTSDTLDAWYVS